jgi:polar amino acid transport system substrate-binding protein
MNSLMMNFSCIKTIFRWCKTIFIGFVFFLSIPACAQNLTIYTEDWPPVSYQNGAKIEGMGVDVDDALQAKMGSAFPILMVPWARGYKALLEEPNVMLFSVGRSVEREKLMSLLGPIAVSSTSLYTRKGHAGQLLAMGDGILKLTVGAYRGSIFADTAKKKGFINIDLAANPKITANMLFAKRFDLWIEGSLAVPSIVKEAGHNVDEVEKVMVLDSLELYLAFSSATQPSIIKAWEEALRALKKDGGFQKIHQRWFPNEPAPMEVLLLSPKAGIH